MYFEMFKCVMFRPAVPHGSAYWPIKKTDERRLRVTEIRILRYMCNVTRMDMVNNGYIRGSLIVARVDEKLRRM